MEFSGSLDDRISVREFYGNFSGVSSLKMTTDWLDCWADECEWVTPHFRLSGKQQISAQWDQLWANFETVMLINDVCSTVVEGDRAQASVIAREVIKLADGSVYKLAGYYRDELVRESGLWRFEKREYETLVEEVPVANS